MGIKEPEAERIARRTALFKRRLARAEGERRTNIRMYEVDLEEENIQYRFYDHKDSARRYAEDPQAWVNDIMAHDIVAERRFEENRRLNGRAAFLREKIDALEAGIDAPRSSSSRSPRTGRGRGEQGERSTRRNRPRRGRRG